MKSIGESIAERRRSAGFEDFNLLQSEIWRAKIPRRRSADLFRNLMESNGDC